MLSQFRFSRQIPLRFDGKLTSAAMAVFLCLISLSAGLFAQTDVKVRPPTQDLLPETTVAFIQIDNFRDLMTKMSEGQIGQLAQDEAIAPLLSGLWDEAKTAYAENAEAEVGVSLEDLQAFPSGEITFAVIAPRRKDPEFMLVIELDDESEAVDRILDRGRELIREEAGAEIETEKSDDEIEFESFMVDGKKIKYFRKDGLMVGCSSEDELNAFVDRMMGREVEKVRPLSVNRKFVTIMNRCVGTKDLRPEARFFVDPIALAKSATRGNFGAQAAINFLPILGLDGLLGIGGSMILTEDDFESVVHAHMLLASPRKGVFEMVALKPTQYEPETWMPSNVMAYMTTSWDIDKMLVELSKMIEMYMGEEGAVDEWIENNINEEVGFDLKEDVLKNLSGRVTFMQWLEPPVKINSQVAILAAGIKEGRVEAIEEALEKVVQRINEEEDGDDEGDESEDEVIESEYKGFRIWSGNNSRAAERFEERRQRQIESGEPDIEINVPEPCFAIVGNSLLFSVQSRKLLEHAIDVHQGDAQPLSEDPVYKAVSEKMTRLLKSDMPCAMMYSDPEDSFRMIFELAKSEGAKSLMARGSEENKYVAGVKRRLEENPLPEFDDVKKYFMPSGGFMTTDDTGYHVLMFGLRERPLEEETDK